MNLNSNDIIDSNALRKVYHYFKYNLNRLYFPFNNLVCSIHFPRHVNLSTNYEDTGWTPLVLYFSLSPIQSYELFLLSLERALVHSLFVKKKIVPLTYFSNYCGYWNFISRQVLRRVLWLILTCNCFYVIS